MSKLWEAISSPANFPNYDSRRGLGYAAPTGFHASRQYQGSYPYKEPPEEHEDLTGDPDADESEEESDPSEIGFAMKFRNKVSTVPAVDPYATKKSDPYYYYGSATPTGMFGEAVAMNRSKGSISPKPTLYKGKEAVAGDGYVGSSIRPFQVIIHNRSTTHGYSKAPIPLETSPEEEEDETLEKLRKVIRGYHLANLSRE